MHKPSCIPSETTFNDKYGLTEAVLTGKKTVMRKIISEKELEKIDKFQVEYYNATFDKIEGKSLLESYFFDAHKERLPYKVGDVVAVAQNYKDIGFDKGQQIIHAELRAEWNNKMFVRADLMPHRIRITNVRVERLQDISKNDCINEGLEWNYHGRNFYVNPQKSGARTFLIGRTHQEAFATLIDRISGKGTWESNPWAFVYEFKLEK